MMKESEYATSVCYLPLISIFLLDPARACSWGFLLLCTALLCLLWLLFAIQENVIRVETERPMKERKARK